MKLDPISLTLFIAVIEEGSITGASEREHITAPAVSKRISELEQTLGTQLLTRHHKGIEPTAAGLALLNLARRAVHYLDDIHLQMLDYAGGMRGQVRIFSNISGITQFLPADLASFVAMHPQVQIQLEERNSLVTAKSVAENAADVGIITRQAHGENIQMLPYETDELRVIVRRDHPLAEREALTFAETLDWEFIGLRTGSAINTQLTRAAHKLHKELKLRIQVTGFDALCLMVSAGLGIAIAPKNLTRLYVKEVGITEVRLDEPWAKRELCICVREQENLPIAAQKLVCHLQRCAKARMEGIANR